jgi:Uma2 family endonuclease
VHRRCVRRLTRRRVAPRAEAPRDTLAGVSQRRRATYADLREVPEHLVAEILDGELVTSPRPASPHALACTAIGAALFDRFNRPPGGSDLPGGWWILDEPELHLGDDVIVPDLAGWRRARMPNLPDVAAFDIVPDWACEVVSPSTARIDRGRKFRIYAREQLGHFWIVDPLARTLEIYRLQDGHWVLMTTHEGSDPVRVEPFEAIELVMGRWWLTP